MHIIHLWNYLIFRVIPIVNENDTVSTYEIVVGENDVLIGDNDTLSQSLHH